MARGTGDVMFGVLGVPDIGPIVVLRMAFQARGDDLRRRHDGKSMRNGVPPAARLDVGLGRAMASLASGEFGRILARGKALEVRILVEGGPDCRMARLTLRVPGISGIERVHRDNRPSRGGQLGPGASVASRKSHTGVRPNGLAGQTRRAGRAK